jgi:hypothetical protein
MAHRRSLGFARDDKGGGGASIWDLLLGSQVSNARPGAPFDFTLRHCRGHKLVISLPTRLSESASLPRQAGAGGMTRREWGFHRKLVARIPGLKRSETRAASPYARSLSRATCVRR